MEENKTQIDRSDSEVNVDRLVRRRPKTRGELLECLQQKIECEVVTSNVEITNIFLDGWLNYAGKYKTYLSNNCGWTIYKSA